MTNKKTGIYGVLESTSNNKVEDLYIIVDKESIAFSVKNDITQSYISFEFFENDLGNQGWSQLVAYLQNNSKLIQNTYKNIYFVLNSAQFIVTKKYAIDDSVLYKNELILVHDLDQDVEIQLTTLANDKMLVFSIPDAINTLLTRSFPTGKWHHYAQWLIQKSTLDGVGLFIFNHFYYIVIHKNGELKLINQFEMGSDEHNTFHLLNTCSQTNIITNTNVLKISGLKQEQLGWVNAINPYFKNMECMTVPSGSINDVLLKESLHHYYAPYFIFS